MNTNGLSLISLSIALSLSLSLSLSLTHPHKAQKIMDEELRMQLELQKRNTDCVYFLASPLTCKKGLDCEFRHNEMARFNPRDCWYWLAGNCLNPNCGFRHPPLESHVDTPSESAQLPYQSSVPTNRTGVPCYFYFSGLCNKGDKCYFLHNSDGSAPTGMSSKTASATINAVLPENKTSIGNDMSNRPEPRPMEQVYMVFQQEENLQLTAPKSVQWRYASPQMSAPECKELAMIKSESLVPAEGFIHSRFYLSRDQSPNEQVEDLTGPQERWESPGFDVLVDNKSENLNYEDDPEYLLALDREHREQHSNFFGCNFEEPVEYEPAYHDSELLYESQIYDSCDSLDNKLIYEVRKIPGHSRDRMLDYILPRKRKLSLAELADDQEGVDLRYYLRNRRLIDRHPIRRLSRRHDSSRLIGQSQEKPRGYVMSQRLHKRLGGSLEVNVTISNGARQAWLRHTQSNRFRQHYKGKKMAKQQFLSSEILKRKPDLRQNRRCTQGSSTFTGPKTLAQIKEDKKKAEEKRNSFVKATSADFQAPRPLSEILKDKRKLAAVGNENTGSC